MIWATPWAWALGLAVALPVIGHLWSRRRPTAQPFPTLRFLRAASPVSRRLHRVQDWPLLLLRMAIVVAICVAAAGPTVTASWRTHAWHTRLHRVIVVDAAAAASARGVVAEEQRDATSSVVIAGGAVAGSLEEAVAVGTRAARHMRTEVVLVWDGSVSVLTRDDLEVIPAGLGMRLRPVAIDSGTAGDAPSVTVETTPSDAAAGARVEAALRRLAMPRGSVDVIVRWPGTHRSAADAQAARSRPASPVTAPWPLPRALRDVADDVRVREAADRSREDDRASRVDVAGRSGQALARGQDLRPRLRGWSEGPRRLILELDAAPSSPLGWWSAVSALESLAAFDRASSAPRWADADVRSVGRAASLPAVDGLPGGLDTRAAWAIVLALLLLEQAWRRGANSASQERHDAA